jgi:two-component system, OmpR family, response regulator QseB
VSAAESAQVTSGAVRVLVAEDDDGLGQVLARGLREQGYVVDLVPDGETAASYLRFYQYEVAVLDWRMPRLTARDNPADRIAGLDAGADDYLVKPFDFGELLARLRALQRRSPSRMRYSSSANSRAARRPGSRTTRAASGRAPPR